MWDFLGALVGAGANMFNASNNQEAQREFNAQQMQIAQQNMAMQKDFAQQGIRWKVDDARAAGLHPLAALGANTTSFSPVSVGGSAATLDGSMGQDISRAISAMKGLDEKAAESAEKASKLTLENSELQNDYLRAQIRKLNNSTGSGPGMPSQGSPNVRTLLDGQPATQTVTPAGAAVTRDKIEQKADTAPATARIRPLGLKLHTYPGSSDAQDIEDRYGNILEEVGGVGNLVLDLGHSANVHWPAIRDYLRRHWRESRRKSDRSWRPPFVNNGMPQP